MCIDVFITKRTIYLHLLLFRKYISKSNRTYNAAKYEDQYISFTFTIGYHYCNDPTKYPYAQYHYHMISYHTSWCAALSSAWASLMEESGERQRDWNRRCRLNRADACRWICLAPVPGASFRQLLFDRNDTRGTGGVSMPRIRGPIDRALDLELWNWQREGSLMRKIIGA